MLIAGYFAIHLYHLGNIPEEMDSIGATVQTAVDVLCNTWTAKSRGVLFGVIQILFLVACTSGSADKLHVADIAYLTIGIIFPPFHTLRSSI